MTIEIKHRGPLTPKQVIELRRYLTQVGKLLVSTQEKVVFFDTSIFPRIGDFATGFSRVSLKVIKNNAVLRIKDGNPSNPIRVERALTFKQKDCPVILYILYSLGLKNGFYRPVHRDKFKLGDIVISIKTDCIMGDHFEVELRRGTTLEDSRVKTLLKQCSLFFWSEKQYSRRIQALMKKFPAINILRSELFGR